MDDRILDDLARLRDEAGDVAGRIGAARDPQARFSGTDAAGAVTVTIDSDARVRDVTIGRGWRQQVGAGAGLSAAVQEATRAAVMARLQSFGEALDEQTAEANPPARLHFDQGIPTDLARRLTDVTADATMDATRGREALYEILSMLETIDQSLDDLSAQVSERAGRTVTGRSEYGHVRVSVDGAGTVVAVDFDSMWLRDAAESGIAREIRDAFGAAYQLAAEHSPQAIIAQSPLGQLQQLASDPVRLAQRLGLDGHRR